MKKFQIKEPAEAGNAQGVEVVHAVDLIREAERDAVQGHAQGREAEAVNAPANTEVVNDLGVDLLRPVAVENVQEDMAINIIMSEYKDKTPGRRESRRRNGVAFSLSKQNVRMN